MTMNVQAPSSVETGDEVVARVAWIAGAVVLGWLAALHLFAVLGFAAGVGVAPVLAPVVSVLAAVAGWAVSWRAGLTSRQGLAAAATVVLVVVGGVSLAALFYDLTWDGQWYHQTAVYEMARGWNPIHDPVHAFGRHTWNLWVLHYAKGPWFVAETLFRATGSIEAAKAMSVIAPLAAVLVVFGVACDFSMRRGPAALVAVLVALNPVTTCGMLTHQVDGILVSLLACAVAAGMSWLRERRALSAFVLFMAAALCVNTKFTGLVYLCFFALAGGLYCLWRRRDLVLRYGLLTGAALLAGVFVFGYNPYVTNTVHRGNPFYPMQGSKEHPSLAERGRDPIELYETPHNMMGKPTLVRLSYGVFGKPGTAPYVQDDAQYMWPFAGTWQDFALYYFHDVRIGGFGPWFSGALLVALMLTVVASIRRAVPLGVLLLLGGTIVGSLLVSQHTWWARYGPHLWWLPIVLAAALMRRESPRVLKMAATVIASVLLVNTVILSGVHWRWEWRSTQALRQQLVDLRQAGPFTVDLAYFDVPVAERFKTEGVAFTTVPKYTCPTNQQVELMSVCRGYPEWIRVCLADTQRAAQLKAKPHWQWSAQP